jgi:hypothetical protein
MKNKKFLIILKDSLISFTELCSFEKHNFFENSNISENNIEASGRESFFAMIMHPNWCWSSLKKTNPQLSNLTEQEKPQLDTFFILGNWRVPTFPIKEI